MLWSALLGLKIRSALPGLKICSALLGFFGLAKLLNDFALLRFVFGSTRVLLRFGMAWLQLFSALLCSVLWSTRNLNIAWLGFKHKTYTCAHATLSFKQHVEHCCDLTLEVTAVTQNLIS